MGLHLRKERLENITATEMSAILGVNPYNTASSVLKKKLDPQPIESIHLRRGHLMEPAVLEALHMDLGWNTIRHEGGTLVLKKNRIAATPDAYLSDKSALIECKSIGYKSFDKWYKEPPIQYHVQAAVQMMVTGIHKSYVAALEAGDPYDCEWRLVVWQVFRDQELENVMKEASLKFWEYASRKKMMKANKETRELVKGLVEANRELIYPDKSLLPKEESHEDKVSKLLSLFE
jgi:putative phage-type endonuclease